MELKKAQKDITKIFIRDLKKNNIEISDDYLVLKASEELGEFIQAYLIYKKKCRKSKYLTTQKAKQDVAKELADVLGLMFVIATHLKIDIDEALVKKWITREWIKK